MANVEHNNDAVRPVHDGSAGNAGDANAVSRMQAEVQQARGSAAGASKLNDGGTSGSDSPGSNSLPKLDLYDGAGGGGGHKGDMSGGGKNRCFTESGDGSSAPNGSSASGRAGSAENTGSAAGSHSAHRAHEAGRAGHAPAGGQGVGAESPTRHYRHR